MPLVLILCYETQHRTYNILSKFIFIFGNSNVVPPYPSFN